MLLFMNLFFIRFFTNKLFEQVTTDFKGTGQKSTGDTLARCDTLARSDTLARRHFSTE